MAQATKKKAPHVPKLRFKEFAGDGEWEEKLLADVADKKIKWSLVGGPFGSNLKHSDYTEQGIRIIQLQNIGNAEFIDTYKIYTSIQKADELISCNIFPGDIILSKMGDPVGRACIIPNQEKRYLMCSDGIRLVVDEKKFNKNFIYITINSYLFRQLLKKTATGSTRKRIGLDELRGLSLYIPHCSEQQRIADCLTSIDESITAESQKLEALTAHKKALMQKLFPAEGEKVPALRFKEFTGAGEWEDKRLGENTLKVGSGITPTGGDKNYIKLGRPFVRSQNVGWGQLLLDDIVFISEDVHKTFLSSEIKINDVLLNITGASIGRCALADSRIEKGNVNQHVCIIRTKNIKLLPVYLCHYILSKYGQKQIDSFQAGGNRQGLNFEQIKSFMIPFPPSKKAQKEKHEEQQRIADCLTSLDEYITAQGQKIALLKEHKKGLMQQLFPRMEEENV